MHDLVPNKNKSSVLSRKDQ